MSNLLKILLLLLVLSAVALCQQSSITSKGVNASDPKSSRDKSGKEGLPTVSRTAEFEMKAKILYDADNWREASVALERFAREADGLANLIRSGVQPYYNASSDERRALQGLSELMRYEDLSNEYKVKRNRAMVMQAECLILIGQKEAAAALLVRALDLIDATDRDLWETARQKLYMLIEVK